MKKIIVGLLILSLFISGCVTNSKPENIDIAKEVEKVVVKTINNAGKEFQKMEMLSNVEGTPLCNKGTQTCYYTWEDTNTNKIVKSATLEVWRKDSPNYELLFSKTVNNDSGTITYKVEEDTGGNTYEARGSFETKECFDNEYD